MKLKNILTIFRKDAYDAIRDGRVLIAILVPIALALFYNFIPSGAEDKPEATVYHTAPTAALTQAVGNVAGSSVDLTFEEAASPQEMREAIESEEADVGLIAPQGFAEAVRSGASPELTVLVPESSGAGASRVISSLDGALGLLAGQEAPANVQTETLQTQGGNVLAEIGEQQYFVLAAVITLVVFISLLVMPVILSEEAEKKTLDALTMVASYAEVITAKALVGLLYSATSVVLLLYVMEMLPEDLLTFAAGMALLAVALIGFGLFMGGIFRNPNQVNTWGTFFILPVMAPAFLVGFELPRLAETVVALVPTGAATRLAINGLSGESLFSGAALSYLVLVLWALAGYALLTWTIRHREG